MVTESYPAVTAYGKESDEKTGETPPMLQPVLNDQAAFGVASSSPMCPMLRTARQCHRNTEATQGAWDDRYSDCLSPPKGWGGTAPTAARA